jgi:hypothetical protein
MPAGVEDGVEIVGGYVGELPRMGSETEDIKTAA